VLGLGILAFLTYSAINAYIKQLIAPLDALIEGARRSANGDYRALENMASSYTEIHSLIFEFSTMARTIANRELDLNEKQENIKRSLAEKEILIKEIHHRVKNNLQIVSSLLSLQRNEIMDPDIAILFAESEKRVGAMAIVHEHLYSSDNLSSIDFLIYLNDLSSSLASSVGTQWLIQGDQITLTIDKAIPCALAVNELMMNSVKHSWTALRPGHFTITAKNENKEIIVTIADDGPGLPANFSPDSDSGLGLEIVNALASQLKGRLLWGNGQNGGARFELRFPEE
jgi:two-component sensor histidine kinase